MATMLSLKELVGTCFEESLVGVSKTACSGCFSSLEHQSLDQAVSLH